MFNQNYSYIEILDKWRLRFKKACPEINISGSPQRSEFRIVVEDLKGNKFILENIARTKYEAKRVIAKTLEKLSDSSLKTIRYIRSSNNKLIERVDGKYWQIMKFIDADKLNRPEYVFEKNRAKLIADFLLKLRKITSCEDFKKEFFSIVDESNANRKDYEFSLKKYVYQIYEDIKTYDSEHRTQIDKIISFLEHDYFQAYDELKTNFCHGDFHSLNIMWKNKELNKVIDWEFLGYKIENYDLANIVGCLGIEDPNALRKDLTIEIIRLLKEQNYLNQFSWKYLIDTIISLRFGWLAEWLRFNDADMIKLELNYIEILIENKLKLMQEWNL